MTFSFINLSTLANHLAVFDLKDFLSLNSHLTPERFLLSYKGKDKSLNQLLAEQIKVHKKAAHKLTKHTLAGCWFTQKAFEQAIS